MECSSEATRQYQKLLADVDAKLAELHPPEFHAQGFDAFEYMCAHGELTVLVNAVCLRPSLEIARFYAMVHNRILVEKDPMKLYFRLGMAVEIIRSCRPALMKHTTRDLLWSPLGDDRTSVPHSRTALEQQAGSNITVLGPEAGPEGRPEDLPRTSGGGPVTPAPPSNDLSVRVCESECVRVCESV
jgi:hypothetical protein